MSNEQAVPEEKKRIKAAIARIAASYGVGKKDLPAIFDCTPNVVNNWVYFGRIPLAQLEKCKKDTGANIDWQLYGTPQTQTKLVIDVDELKKVVKAALLSAVAFDLIEFKTPGACDQLTAKLSNDLEGCQRQQQQVVEDDK